MRMTGKSSSMDEQNERPREVDVSDGYLNRFEAPLWDKLDLESCKAVSAIEGKRDGCRFVILDIEHRDFGPLAGNGKRTITTFFIVAIPASVAGRHVSWRPQGYQACADGTHVYVARPRARARPAAWRDMVEATLKTAASLKTPAEAERTGRPLTPAWRPVGAGATVHGFWALVMLAFAVLLAGAGLGTMFGWIDYRPDCFPDAAAAACMTVWRVETAFVEGVKFLLGGGFCLGGAWYYRERYRKRIPRKPGPRSG